MCKPKRSEQLIHHHSLRALSFFLLLCSTPLQSTVSTSDTRHVPPVKPRLTSDLSALVDCACVRKHVHVRTSLVALAEGDNNMFEPTSDSDEFDMDFGDIVQESSHCENIVNNKGLWKDEDLQIAVRRNDIDFVQRILAEGFPVNKILSGGWNLLMYACDYGVCDIVTLLLKSGADAKTQIDTFSALMAVCCSRCDSEERLALCAKVLISDGAVVNEHDRHHLTPLMYACQHNRVTLVQLFLSHGADVNYEDARGWTAFVYAGHNGNESLMKLLLEASSDPYKVSNGEETTTMSEISRNGSYVPVDDLRASSCHQYGDVEVFLLGLELEDVIPLFKKHSVSLAVLFTMTENDLKQMGIPQMAVRKKILTAVGSIHKRQWNMPEQNHLSGNELSSSEVVMTLSHLTKHVQYLQATSNMIVGSIKNEGRPLDMRMEDVKAQQMLCEVKRLEESIEGLQQHVLNIKHQLQDASTQYHRRITYAAVFSACAVVCSGLLLGYKFLR